MTQRVPGRTRASRFKVPNNEQVVLTIGTERVFGTLSVLSITGGTMRVTRRRTPGTLGEIKIETVAGSITAVIELLATRGDSAQAFRFVHIETASKKRLETALDNMHAQGLGDGRTDPFQHMLRFARKLLPRTGKS
jgi:hypothetical protein